MRKKFLFSGMLMVIVGLRMQAAIYSTNFTGIAGVIPDGQMIGYVNRQVISGMAGIITNVNVRLNITNGYNGDLYGYLVGPDGGFTVLLNRVGTGSGDPAQNEYGFADSGFDITLADGAGNPDVHGVNGGGVAVTGNYQSEDGTLNTAFAGQTANGNWTLFLADLSGGQQSTVVSWGVDIFVQSFTSLAVASSANPAVSGQSVSFTATVIGAGGTPTGYIIFRTNDVALSTNLLNGSGMATSDSTTSLQLGTNMVVAEYASGQDGNFIGSTNYLDDGYSGQLVNPVAPASYTISGLVELQSFSGTNRAVEFVLSAVGGGTTNYLQTNDVVLTFSNSAAAYSLPVPTNTTHLSAKTAWNLRRRQAVTFTAGAATVNFTGSNNLRGGDLVTVPGGTISDTDNAVTSADYLLLLGNYLQTVGTNSTTIGRADINGDGNITSADYLLLLGNYLTAGDPQ